MNDWENHPPPKPPSPWDMDKRIALLEQSQRDIRQELHSINSNITKLVWIVVGAVIVGLMNLVIRSGNIPGM
jgi:hypothetical protein